MENYQQLFQSEDKRKQKARDILGFLTDKWILPILGALDEHERLRFSEILVRFPSISKKVLSASLQKLHRNEFINRTDHYKYPAKVEYGITERGKEFLRVYVELIQWIYKE